MGKREDAKIAALVKKHTAQIKPPAADRAAQYDDTLKNRPAEQDNETKRLFKDMKRREF
jgi:hypothetical protein